MQATVKKAKNPFERISRRSVLGVMGVGMTGILIGCNDDLSPLSATLTSDMTDLTATGSITLTAKLDVGYANSVEFYDGATLLDTVPLLLGQATKQITLDASKNGKHTFITKITSSTGKQAYSNPVDVMVNIGVTPPPVAPTISLSASSGSVTTNTGITLTATAAATTGKITKVEFFEGITSLGSSAIAPYTLVVPAFTTTNNGTHTYTAKVTTDASSLNTAISSAVDVVVNIPAPLPTITLAASSSTVTAAGNLTLTATVAGGTVTQVEFFDGATSLGLGVLAGASYTKTVAFTATSPALSHSYTAKGTVAGVAATVDSAAVNVNVNIGNKAPTITLGSSSLSVTANGSITLTAVPTANIGTIAKVEFFDSASPTPTVAVSTVTAAPWQFTPSFSAANNGVHNYTAKATDSSNNSATSTPAIAVTVNIPTAAPTITLTTTSSATITAAGNIALNAVPTVDPNVTITKVELFDGTTSLGLLTAPSYGKTIPVTSADNRLHAYTAVVTDSSGKTATSTAVNIAVNIAVVVTNPTVTLTATPTTLSAAGTVALSATVTKGSGTITKVEFYDGTTLLGSSLSTVSPYAFTTPAYTSANNGSKSYTAKITASDGGTVTSAVVSVTINIATVTGTKVASVTDFPSVGSSITTTLGGSHARGSIIYRSGTLLTGGITINGMFFIAYDRACTHNFCAVPIPLATSHVSTCPCHGATFNFETKAAGGQAIGMLPIQVIKPSGTDIYI